ncbi:MAG: mannitol dehydrogenase family protein [Pseudomonadota bacterium]
MVKKLDRHLLAEPPKNVSVPAYEPQSLKPGILHIGVGNFHRAHQAFYLDRLFNMGLDLDWAIIGSGVKPQDAAMRETLKAQDWLTTIVELDPSGLSAMVCGAMIDYIDVDPASIIATLTRPEIRIVSLTITEGGYFVDPQTGGFDVGHPDIVADIETPSAPRTVFGILIAGLRRRRELGHAPFTVMSCDNLPENGHATRNAVIGLGREMDPELARWMKENVAFPNGMVDCITPATSERERDLVRSKFDLDDAAPVVCEPFRQWVLEDNFPAGRPALENAGVQFVDDVAPYELVKLRILNGGHAAIAYPAALLGIEFAHEAMANPLVRGYLDRLVHEEIIPVIPASENIDPFAYYERAAERFSNSAVRDTIARLCLDGSNRQPKFILPSISERLAKGLPVEGLVLEVALWCRYCTGTDEAGNPIILDDENAGLLRQKAKRARKEPAAFLEMDQVFGPLAHHSGFRSAFADTLQLVWQKGATAALENYLRD